MKKLEKCFPSGIDAKMENFESARVNGTCERRRRNVRANAGGGVGEYTRAHLFLRIFARTLNIIIKKSYYNFVSLTLSLSLSLTRTCFLRRGRAFRLATIRVFYVLAFHSLFLSFFLSPILSLSISLSLSFTHSLVHLLNKLPPLSPCLHLINTKNVYSTPSILSSTSMYNCRKRSMFSSLVSQ